MTPRVLFDSFGGRFADSWRFSGYRETLAAATADEVPAVLQAAEEAAAAGQYAVGFISYEAATAINPELPSLPPCQGLPLAWFAVFGERQAVEPGAGLPETSVGQLLLTPQLSAESYRREVERIRTLIGGGDAYQVNFTMQLDGEFGGDPLALYGSVCRAQRPQFSALFDIGSQLIISASPELFFSLKDGRIVTRPMKGTAPRGRWPAEDRQLAAGLLASPKERAENLMIVDLLRNDLGKIARTGTVRVDALFDIESYPTVHQMTSTVSATVRDGVTLAGILGALFPCGSVTGAPKRRSMEIITASERQPRGIYCGAIGCLAPGGEAVFSVAIRTLLVEKATGAISLGVGSGITYDSEPAAEYAESLAKAAFLSAGGEEFHLFETVRRDKEVYRQVERHLRRIAESARLFGFPFDRNGAEQLLARLDARNAQPLRVKLSLFPSGRLAISAAIIAPEPEPLVVGIAAVRVDPDNRLLYHKTSRRELLDGERRLRPDCSEVLFFNIRGELTEGSYNNIILKSGGRLLTPPLESGLLPGVLRSELLDSGTIEEKLLFAADLFSAEEIWLVNSLRGRRRAVLAEGETMCVMP